MKAESYFEMAKLHPVRAFLAVVCIGSTAYFIYAGIAVPDAWWGFLGAVGVFYFAGGKTSE